MMVRALLEAYRQARKPKEIHLFRGPHPLGTQEPRTCGSPVRAWWPLP